MVSFFGAIVGGKLADRYGSKRILVTFLVIGFITLTMLSFKPSMIMLYILIAIAGGTTTGTQIVTNAYASQYYPNEIRSTGVGWASAELEVCSPLLSAGSCLI
ncbi:MFS transporter [Peribacillus simplex]|uniref:MFS transporter n=1 Tax=Peribacillus simplex TaxID=1478 RepID=UPI00366C69C9